MIIGFLKFFLKFGLTSAVVGFLIIFSLKYKTSITLQGEYILFQSEYGLLVLMIIFIIGFLVGIFFEKIKSFIFD